MFKKRTGNQTLNTRNKSKKKERDGTEKCVRARIHHTLSVNSLTNMKMQAISTRDALVFSIYFVFFFGLIICIEVGERERHRTREASTKFDFELNWNALEIVRTLYVKEIKTINIKTNMSFPPYCLWKQKIDSTRLKARSPANQPAHWPQTELASTFIHSTFISESLTLTSLAHHIFIYLNLSRLI